MFDEDKKELDSSTKALMCICGRLAKFKELLISRADESDSWIKQIEMESKAEGAEEEDVIAETLYARGSKETTWEIVEEFCSLFDTILEPEELEKKY